MRLWARPPASLRSAPIRSTCWRPDRAMATASTETSDRIHRAFDGMIDLLDAVVGATAGIVEERADSIHLLAAGPRHGHGFDGDFRSDPPRFRRYDRSARCGGGRDRRHR